MITDYLLLQLTIPSRSKLVAYLKLFVKFLYNVFNGFFLFSVGIGALVKYIKF